MERNGFEVTEEQLDKMLDRLQGEDKLIATEIDGKTVYRTAKSARRAEKKSESREVVFEIILNAGTAGILTTEIRDRVSLGSGGGRRRSPRTLKSKAHSLRKGGVPEASAIS